MHFPGIPERTFNAVDATSSYRQLIRQENSSRSFGEAQLERLPRERSSPSMANKIGDMLPGLASINEVYNDIGYKWDPTSGRLVAPTLTGQTPLDRSLSSFKDAPMRSTPLDHSLSRFSDMSSEAARWQQRALNAERALATERQQQTRQTPLNRSWSSNFKDMSTQQTPLHRSLSSFHAAPSCDSTKRTPLHRSLSSFKDAPMGQGFLQHSLLGLSGTDRCCPACHQCKGNSAQGDSHQATCQGEHLPQLSRSTGALSPQVGRSYLGKSSPHHGSAVYLQMEPRELKRHRELHKIAIQARQQTQAPTKRRKPRHNSWSWLSGLEVK